MTKPWQICLVLIVIFAAGAVSGGLVAFHIARRNAARPPPPPDVWVARDIDRAARILELTPEQRDRIQPIVKSDIEELTKLRRQSPALHAAKSSSGWRPRSRRYSRRSKR